LQEEAEAFPEGGHLGREGGKEGAREGMMRGGCL